jgi:hypothetical protein
MMTKAQINPDFVIPILTIANALTERHIPFTLNVIFDGLQIRFPWNDGDLICHSYSYGHEDGNVESMGCPWDDEDVSCLSLDEAIDNIEEWYAEAGI